MHALFGHVHFSTTWFVRTSTYRISLMAHPHFLQNADPPGGADATCRGAWGMLARATLNDGVGGGAAGRGVCGAMGPVDLPPHLHPMPPVLPSIIFAARWRLAFRRGAWCGG